MWFDFSDTTGGEQEDDHRDGEGQWLDRPDPWVGGLGDPPDLEADDRDEDSRAEDELLAVLIVSDDERTAAVQVYCDILSFHGSSPCSGSGWFCNPEYCARPLLSGRGPDLLRRRADHGRPPGDG